MGGQTMTQVVVRMIKQLQTMEVTMIKKKHQLMTEATMIKKKHQLMTVATMIKRKPQPMTEVTMIKQQQQMMVLMMMEQDAVVLEVLGSPQLFCFFLWSVHSLFSNVCDRINVIQFSKLHIQKIIV